MQIFPTSKPVKEYFFFFLRYLLFFLATASGDVGAKADAEYLGILSVFFWGSDSKEL